MEANGHPSPIQAAQPSGRAYREHWIPRGRYQLYTREYPGQEPTVVLMHGFPDDLHLYDRLVPELAGRRLVTFDFLGWGASDKPTGYPYTASNQTGDLDAVLEHLQLGSVVLVAHDASGPPAINWALDHPQRVAALVLLNTYYARMPGLRPPEAIRAFSTPVVRSVARPISRLFGDLLFRRLYRWQVGRFFRDPEVREQFLPLLYQQFAASPSAHEAFFSLNRDLLPTVAAGTATVPRLHHFGRPVRVVFGAADPYLNTRVARRFHELFPTSELFLLDGARHYVQLDEPHRVGQLILTTPPSG
jgi:pimeloyl-ACP methyl ester carboxylesterase